MKLLARNIKFHRISCGVVRDFFRGRSAGILWAVIFLIMTVVDIVVFTVLVLRMVHLSNRFLAAIWGWS